jgi:hypothetical protein
MYTPFGNVDLRGRSSRGYATSRSELKSLPEEPVE